MADIRFRAACKMLRLAGMPSSLPLPRRSESPVDYLVRAGLAPSPQVAAEMLLLGAGLASLANEVMAEIDTAAH